MHSMRSNRHADLLLRCARCGETFVYSAGEQELCAVRGVGQEPKLCPSCRGLLGQNYSGGRIAASGSTSV